MISLKRLIFAAIALCPCLSIQAKDGFAIVIDKNSYEQARNEVDAYARSVEELHGLKVYTVIDKWHIPDSIRATLIKLHRQKDNPIVGAVLIGDIPIAMVRDGQHMTSAFKMDQRRDRRESSVPSDRYYDDFGLRFKSLGKDEEKPYFYYSVTADSRQRLRPDIYSGRIRPTDEGGVSRYSKLKSYLVKLVKEKNRQQKLQQLFYFSGHGYISESKVARIDEKSAYFEHFPNLKGRSNSIGYMDHTDRNPIKESLMNELMRNDLSLAVLHHHGYWNTQYLNNLDLPATVKEAKNFIIKNCREHLYSAKQRGKNADSLRTVFEKEFDLPSTWLENALDEKLAEQDSLSSAALDLYIEDFAGYGYHPNVPVVIIDACFCGSFHLDDCIADEYIFQPGRTVACVANSVNVLQDKWSDRLIGLINNGGCIGDVVRYSSYLESHVIGDPTFRFASSEKKVLDLDHIINENKPSVWKRLLKDSHPDIQCLAMEHLCRLGLLSSKDLRSIYESSPAGIVRLQALLKLADYKDDNFIEVLKIASQDSYELVQRQALRLIGRSGDERLIPSLIKVSIANNTSERCNFNAMSALGLFPKAKLLAEFAKQFDDPSICYLHKDSVRATIKNVIERSADRWVKDTKEVMNPELTTKKRIMLIRQLRNFMNHSLMPELLNYLPTMNDEDAQVALLEAFGWHEQSYMVPKISEVVLKMSKDMKYSEKVRNEALKTYNRLNGK